MGSRLLPPRLDYSQWYSGQKFQLFDDQMDAARRLSQQKLECDDQGGLARSVENERQYVKA